MIGQEQWTKDRLDMDRVDVCTQMGWELRALLTKGFVISKQTRIFVMIK